MALNVSNGNSLEQLALNGLSPNQRDQGQGQGHRNQAKLLEWAVRVEVGEGIIKSTQNAGLGYC